MQSLTQTHPFKRVKPTMFLIWVIRLYQETTKRQLSIVLKTVLRKSNHWQPENYYFGDSVTFESIELTLSVEDIYERVDNNEMAGHLQQKQMSKETVTVDMVIEPLSSADFVDSIIKG